MAVLFPCVSLAANITGNVIDAETNDPLGYATVSTNTSGFAYTDDQGKFSISYTPEIKQITFSMMGYKTTIKPISASTTDLGTISLTPEPIALDNVIVTASSLNCDSGIELEKIHATKAKKFIPTKSQYASDTDAHAYCYPTECKENYTLKGTGENRTCESINGYDCTNQIPNADSATQICIGDECTCTLVYCADGYKQQDDKCIKIGKQCSQDQTTNIQHGLEFEQDGLEICHVVTCECGYKPNTDQTACDTDSNIGTPCPATPGATTATWQCPDGNPKSAPICTITACDQSTHELDLKNNNCIDKKTGCTGKYPLPEFAKSGHREYKNGKDVCIVDECKKGYIKTNNNTACTPERTYSAAEIAEREQVLKNAKDKENSVESRLMGGAAIGATGIGGMMLMESLSEQRIDSESDADMAAYLATFRCDYGSGHMFHGGEKNITLDGGNQLIGLKSEYIKLAAEVKSAKEQLNLKPGIESEVILNSADTGLYDNESLGKTGGTFASISRALQDKNSDDAKKIAAEREKTSDNLTTGIGVAVTGVALGITANNINEQKFKNRPTKINSAPQSTSKKGQGGGDGGNQGGDDVD